MSVSLLLFDHIAQLNPLAKVLHRWLFLRDLEVGLKVPHAATPVEAGQAYGLVTTSLLLEELDVAAGRLLARGRVEDCAVHLNVDVQRLERGRALPRPRVVVRLSRLRSTERVVAKLVALRVSEAELLAAHAEPVASAAAYRVLLLDSLPSEGRR